MKGLVLRQTESMKKILILVLAGLLSACASYGGRGLQPGVATVGEVEATMGPAALRWAESDGGQSLAFPRGPAGYHTFIARFDAGGRLVAMHNVLEPRTFALIQEGMTQDEVLRVLGPPYPGWTVYFESRDELVWEWRFCDDWAEPARFNVMFSGKTGRVTKTLAIPERFSHPFGFGNRRAWCSR